MMLKIKYFALSFFLLQSFLSNAQREKIEQLSNFDEAPLRWGFYLGVNYNDFNISYKAPVDYPNAFVETEPKIGFNIGLLGDVRLHQNINLRLEPGLMTNTKTLYFNHLSTEMDSVRQASSTFLHIPLVVQFSANRLNNMRPYVTAGMVYDYNFASNFDNPDDNSSGEFRMTKGNFMYELGVGMDFYFQYFKLSPSIRGVFAINNELKDDDDPNSPWTSPVDYFGTRGIYLKFSFQ